MPDWQERITVETEPALRVEHELRYRLAKRAIAQAQTWCDLGCGNGVAAADALDTALPGRVVLVDRDEGIVDTACETLRDVSEAVGVVADLTQPDDLARVRAALTELEGQRVVTCFEVIEHLEVFAPLVEMLVALGESADTTVLLSVPNDEFWAIDNPHHQTVWSEGAFEELRGMRPGGHVIARQTSLQGSAIVVGDGEAGYEVPVRVTGGSVVPTPSLAAFGPRALDALGGAAVAPVDLDEQRRWVRQRESNISYLQDAQRFAEQAVREREDWRRYIHELEDRLGIPRAGSPEAP